MALSARKLLQSSITRRLKGGAGSLGLLNASEIDQQRHASSHAENTNTFIKEVSDPKYHDRVSKTLTLLPASPTRT